MIDCEKTPRTTSQIRLFSLFILLHKPLEMDTGHSAILRSEGPTGKGPYQCFCAFSTQSYILCMTKNHFQAFTAKLEAAHVINNYTQLD